MSLSGFDARLAQERRARLQAERLLALRSEELYSANRKLAKHAEELSFQVIEQREENAALKGRATRVVAELAVATGRAEIAEQRLWDAVTAVEDGFAVFDRDCRLVAANPAYLAFFDGISDVAPGASYETLLRIAADEGIVDLEGAHPDDWLERMIARWESDPIPRTDIRLWNGRFVRLIDKRTPQGDTVCLGIDLTSTLRRERELRQARDAALAASRAKSAFLANMSHEFRTPMNGIVSMAELLGETSLDTEQKLFAETIRHSGEALLELIRDILDYSKIEAGRLVLHEEEFDLLAMILEIFGLLRPRVEGDALRFRLDIALDVPGRLIGDSGRMRQVLFNLIGNAVKFTDRGHVLVRVRGAAGPTGEVPLTLEVEDTGIGIPREMQAHVFGEFNQVEDQANRSHDGTGLGLAITRRLLGLMGGEIALESEPGQGSTFRFGVTLRHGGLEGTGHPLPPEMREVRLYGPLFSERARDLVGMLAAAGARIRAEPRPETSALPGAGETVILLGHAAEAEGMAESLKSFGHVDPILHFGTGEEETPPGLCAFELPDAIEDLPACLARALRAAAPPPEERTRMSILAAEDNATNRLVFCAMLKSLDLDLRLVENGAELVEAYRQERPDMILTDISMPGMDGLAATGAIRALEAEAGLPRIPIVAMTAHALEGDRERFLNAGLDDYLSKPLRKAGLLAVISAHAPEGRNPVP